MRIDASTVLVHLLFTIHLFTFGRTTKKVTRLNYCQHTNTWAEAPTGGSRTLVLGVFYPSDQLLASLAPAIGLAIKDIENTDCILPGYNLTVLRRNTGCKAAKGMEALFSMMHNPPKKVALFGDACESVNEPVAAAAKYWNIMQLSYYETHPKFTLGTESQELYRTFYRMVPGVYSEQMAQRSFVEKFGWKHFGMVGQTNEERFNLPHSRRGRILSDEQGFSIAASTGFSTSEPNYAAALSKLKNESARIIIGDFNMSSAGGIFCEAYRQNLTGARHVWILSSQHTRISVNRSATEGNCRPEELESALQGHFVFQFAQIRTDVPRRNYFMDARHYMRQYKRRCRKTPGCDVANPFHAYAYDGIWTMAFAMHKGIKEQWESEGRYFDPIQDLSDYDKWSSRLADALSNNTFEGVTGKVQFHPSNERLGRVSILQYRYGDYETVGEYDATAESLVIFNETSLFFWTPDGLPPPDTIRRDNQTEHIEFPVFCVMCALTSFGILLALCFLSVNVYFRNHRFIKMSSPNMNNLIIAGSILTYVSVVLLGVDTSTARESTYNVLCTAKVGILSVGFSLAFGSMFSKTWRVHSIFTNIKLNKKAIKDYKLFLIVFALFLIDTIIVTVWIFVSPLHRREGVVMNETNQELNVLITRWREYCASDHMTIFQGLLFGYKGILLILGCFLAWETRHVNVPALNDSKYIGMSVYNVVLMCALGVAILFILENNVNAAYVLISLFIIFCTTLTLCLVFVPKVVELARNPKGTGAADRRYRQAMMKSVGTERKLSEGEQESHKDQLVRMEQDNQVWRKMLDDKKLEIVELLNQLQEYGEVTMESTSLPKETTSQLSHSSVPDDPYGGVYLGPPGPSFAQKQDERERQQRQEHDGTQQQNSLQHLQPCLPKSPTPEEMSETTSLLKRSSIGSLRDKLTKLRTSFSRSSMPATFSIDINVCPEQIVPNSTLGTSSSVYQSLRELVTDRDTNVNGRTTGSCGGDLHSGNYGHRVSNSNSSEYTEDDEDEYAEGEEASSNGSMKRRRRLRYVDPSLITEEPPEMEKEGSFSYVPSIRENRLSAFNSELSSSECMADDEHELLSDEEHMSKEEDALL